MRPTTRRPSLTATAPVARGACVVNALPSSFMDQGEFGASSSIADVIEVECEDVYAEHHVRISANELYSRCDQDLHWRTPTANQPEKNIFGFTEGSSCRNDARQRR